MSKLVQLHLTPSQKTTLRKGGKIQFNHNKKHPRAQPVMVNVESRDHRRIMHSMKSGKGKRISGSLAGGGIDGLAHNHYIERDKSHVNALERRTQHLRGQTSAAGGTDLISGDFLTRRRPGAHSFKRTFPIDIPIQTGGSLTPIGMHAVRGRGLQPTQIRDSGTDLISGDFLTRRAPYKPEFRRTIPYDLEKRMQGGSLTPIGMHARR